VFIVTKNKKKILFFRVREAQSRRVALDCKSNVKIIKGKEQSDLKIDSRTRLIPRERPAKRLKKTDRDIIMVVLEGSQMAATTLGGPYAQGAPALKIVQKRFLGLHQWLSPVYGKEIKEQLVSVTQKKKIFDLLRESGC
jgi:hypothetical protein